MKKIAFLLPSIPLSPIGGYKVVYEYANRLVKDGYIVNIYYPSFVQTFAPKYIEVLRFFKAILRFLYCSISNKSYHTQWFNLDKRVNERMVWSLSDIFINNHDIYIATSVRTALSLKKFKNSNKFYLIQGYEVWNDISEDVVLKTYHFPFKKFVISTWLKSIVEKYDPSCVLLPNGFDFNFFKKSKEIEERDKFCITMLYHTSEGKGCQDGFNALDIVKSKYPQLKVNLFGAYNKPANLPQWYTYYKSPDKETFNQIYNEAAIFIGTSWSEGWGLTVGEAMICGCAVACTDNDGYLEMVEPNISALVSPIKDPQSLATNIIKLIENDNLRFSIANQGNMSIRKFSWEQSYQILKTTIENQ